MAYNDGRRAWRYFREAISALSKSLRALEYTGVFAAHSVARALLALLLATACTVALCLPAVAPEPPVPGMHWWAMPEWWTAIATAALVTVAVSQLWLFLVQLRYIRKSLVSTKAAADAARESADAAKKSADAAQTIDRAYVFAIVQFHGVSLSTGAQAVNSATVMLWNYGKTPAVLTKFRANCFLTKGYTYPDDFGPTAEDRTLPDGMVIASNSSANFPVAFTITAEEWDEVERAEKSFGFRGRIDYKDVFGVEHATGFCWHFGPHGAVRTLQISPSKLNFRT